MQSWQETKKLKPISRKVIEKKDSKRTKIFIIFVIIILLGLLLCNFPWHERFFEDPVWWKFGF